MDTSGEITHRTLGMHELFMKSGKGVELGRTGVKDRYQQTEELRDKEPQPIPEEPASLGSFE